MPNEIRPCWPFENISSLAYAGPTGAALLTPAVLNGIDVKHHLHENFS